MTKFLGDDALEQSAVVANCRMNRERNLTGSNGYSNEIGFDPLAWLKSKSATPQEVHWLDLCCGSGTALIEAARIVHRDGLESRVGILGVDLVGMFSPVAFDLTCLRLLTASLTSWKPDRQYDLITCVHGLHYIGDKLLLIARAASWLTANGMFVANLDLGNFKLQDGRSASRGVMTEFRRNGWQYDSRKKRLVCDSHRIVNMPFRYLGADDQAGPNYTGQPAVNSYYERYDQDS